ncbi:MAG TPA: hypothetical protein VGJ93_02130 [Desulfuromonadaceae bacterium]|jgi:hypothetical protein
MIFESAPWKEELLKIADRLERRYNQKRWSERSLFLLEREVFVGFFSVRKLMESNKISDKIKEKEVELAVYPAGEKPVTLLNQHKFPELYDLYAGKTDRLTYHDICNQFIHSSIFAPFTPFGKSLVGAYIASDRAKKKQLYYITLVKIVEIFKNVGSDEASELVMTFDDKKQEYVVRVGAIPLEQ